MASTNFENLVCKPYNFAFIFILLLVAWKLCSSLELLYSYIDSLTKIFEING